MIGGELRYKHVDRQVVIDLAKQMTEEDVYDYLKTHGDLEYYQLALHQNVQRKGQAFANALDTKWREHIINMPEDPFNTSDNYSVYLAVAWLTAQEIANES